MKRILTTLALTGILACGAAARADEMRLQIDETFTQTRAWLTRENLSVTGGPGARDDAAAFRQEAILFYGEAVGNPAHGSPAQREMMAKRAAVVTAQRALAEYLEGFALVGDTLVRDGVTQYDVIRSAVTAYVKGTQVVVQEYNREKDMAVALIKVGLHGPEGFASLFYKKMVEDPKAAQSLASPKPAFKAAPVKLEAAYDGLIVDATEQSFRPALINRIFSAKGDVLYDPAKVSQKVLVEQGCGEYTNTVDKARAALETRGVKNPLVVKAAGTLNPSDLQLADDDAVRVFSADQRGGFLAGAKVAFVLK